jgi:outer membrane lipopolysaccharide assembly protein LptE/RlpB
VSQALNLHRLAVLLLALLIAGCGFQPRGQTPRLSGVPGPILISGILPASPLQRALVRELEAAGATVAPSRTQGVAVLDIDRLRSERRVLSVDSRNKAVEYELAESARFALRSADGRELVPAQTARVLRIQFRPGDAILASDREAELVREDMREELASKIVRRLAAVE